MRIFQQHSVIIAVRFGSELIAIDICLLNSQIAYSDKLDPVSLHDGPAVVPRDPSTPDYRNLDRIFFHVLFPETACLIISTTCSIIGLVATENLL
jgi:hypothetical protein